MVRADPRGEGLDKGNLKLAFESVSHGMKCQCGIIEFHSILPVKCLHGWQVRILFSAHQ